ncbi:acetoacetate decarboxylase family protein [Nocardioides sp. SYSU DS0663]|uniref:acetoacetate decarboxylase family protein n=1 Tax=Nocardioides sp. SYSU DS0663 TaxID=3416445 RepID=UPI003F4BAFAA
MTETSSTSSSPAGAPSYPEAPWQMAGQLFLSLFRVPEPVDDLRPAGVYGAAFVSYEEPSPLTYSELLVARPVPNPAGRGRRVSICDIWVDSAASVAGGRELWAIPKGLCDFRLESERRGPFARTEWAATLDGQPVASARFTDGARLAPRVPFKGSTWQPGIEDTGGQDRSAVLQGSAQAMPCWGAWEFDADGPLGWLAGRRALASFRMRAFRMSFG